MQMLSQIVVLALISWTNRALHDRSKEIKELKPTILVKSVGTLEHLKTLTLSTTPPPHPHPVQC